MKKIELVTERLLLRGVEPEDQKMIFTGLSDPEVTEFYGVNFQTYEATAEQMKYYSDNEMAGTGKFWVVCEKNNGAVAGVGGVYNISHEHRKGEVGFWLFKNYWGKGYLQEGMNAIVDFSFKVLNLHRIEGVVETTNIRCKKAIEKAGFLYEGTLKDAEIKNGKFISLCYYAIINPSESES